MNYKYLRFFLQWIYAYSKLLLHKVRNNGHILSFQVIKNTFSSSPQHVFRTSERSQNKNILILLPNGYPINLLQV